MHLQEEDIKASGGLSAILATFQVSSCACAATCDVPDHRIYSETSGQSNPQDFPEQRISDVSLTFSGMDFSLAFLSFS